MRMPKKIYIGLVLLISGALVSACGPSPEEQAATASAQTEVAASETPVPSQTPAPTSTNTPIPTSTPLPTATHTPAPEKISGPEIPKFLGLSPKNWPLDIWEGIPVLQQAIKGEEEYGGYYYTTDLTVSEIKLFYQDELKKNGWKLSAVGEAENGSFLLIFQNDNEQISITIYHFGEPNTDPESGFHIPASAVLIIKENYQE